MEIKRVPVLATTTTAPKDDAEKIAMPIIEGSSAYLSWLEENVQ